MATMASLTFGGVAMHTIELPWIPTDPGGKPEKSCVPAGRYQLIPHTRANGDEVRALVNHGLGVYHYAAERPHRVGRYLILIHVGNWVTDIIGCIAPGLDRTVTDAGPMVTKSRKAMSALMNWLGNDCAEILIKDSD